MSKLAEIGGAVTQTVARAASDPLLPYVPQRRRDLSKPIRYTVDMDQEQHAFMKLFAIHNDVKAALVFRSLVYLLESRVDLAQLVVNAIDSGELPVNTAKRRKPGEKPSRAGKVRYTIDLNPSQHTFLRLFAAHNDIRVSVVVRALLFLLETRIDLAVLVIDSVFEHADDTELEDHEIVEIDSGESHEPEA